MSIAHQVCCLLIFASSVFSGVHVRNTDSVSSWANGGWGKRIGKYQYCKFCQATVRRLNGYIASNKTFDDIRKPAIKSCVILLTKRGTDGKFMCPGMIDSFVPAMLFVADQLVLDPLSVCQKLNFCPPDRLQTYSSAKFSPNLKQSENKISHHRRCTLDRNNTLSIVQINDYHVDRKYAEGSPTDCGVYACCRTEYNGTGSAGPFGDYNCDVPWKTIDVLLDAIKKLEPRPEFILFSGDFPPHDISEESWTTQLEADHDGIAFLKQNLPNFTIYPTLGNHESFPMSLYYQPHADFKNLNNLTAVWWQQLFPVPADQVENIKYSAYYTTLVRPGLRLLSFNTQYGFAGNFYGLLNEKIPAYYQHREFIETTLHEARLKEEKVIMMGHVPSGAVTDAYRTWGDYYTDVVTRYADVIVLQVFGHTHFDQFELVTDPRNRYKPTGVVFIAPSMTSQGRVNPSFRVYHLDAKTYELQDYDQYYINLTEANAAGKATVRLSYSALQEYGLPDMSPDGFLDLVDRFRFEDETFNRYWQNFYAKSNQDGDCDSWCRKLTICKARSASQRDFIACTDDETLY